MHITVTMMPLIWILLCVLEAYAAPEICGGEGCGAWRNHGLNFDCYCLVTDDNLIATISPGLLENAQQCEGMCTSVTNCEVYNFRQDGKCQLLSFCENSVGEEGSVTGPDPGEGETCFPGSSTMHPSMTTTTATTKSSTMHPSKTPTTATTKSTIPTTATTKSTTTTTKSTAHTRPPTASTKATTPIRSTTATTKSTMTPTTITPTTTSTKSTTSPTTTATSTLNPPSTITPADGEVLLVIGGVTDNLPLSSVDVITGNFDVISGAVPDLPKASHGSTAGVIDGQVLVCGGYLKEEELYDQCQHLDLSSNAWTSSSKMGRGRSSAASVVHSGAMHLFGGYNAWLSVERYYSEHKAWVSIPEWEMPQSNERFCAVSYGNYIYHVGGLVGATATPTVLRLSTLMNKYEKMSALQEPRYDHACVVTFIRDQEGILVTGGFKNGTFLSSTEFYGFESEK